ncbi:MAG: ATP-binding protein [Phycisphaerales bacterium JB037]
MPNQPPSHDAPSHRAEFELSNDPRAVRERAEQLIEHAERAGYAKAARFAVRLAFEEAVTNAFRHGHRELPESATVRVEIEISPEAIRLTVEDQGPGFEPGEVPDPTLAENLSKPFGRGLMLIRAYMTRVRYNERGNRVEMEYRPQPGGAT